MSEPTGAVLFNHETGGYEFVPTAEIDAKLGSGDYSAPSTVITRGEGGTRVREVSELDTAATQGESVAEDVRARLGAESRTLTTQEAYDTAWDKATVFAEGVVDAASVGLIHDHSRSAEIAREVNSGSALLGQLTGFAVGMGLPGPISALTKGGKALGSTAAKKILGEAAERGASQVVTRGLEEAAIGAAIMGASAVGHQVSDAVIEDKPFSGEVILHEMKVGGLMGLGAGVLAGGFAAYATRGAVRAQGGLLSAGTSETAAALDKISGVRAALDEALETHAQRLGVVEVLAKEGKIPGVHMEVRAQALKEARNAAAQLEKHDLAKLMDAPAKEYGRARAAFERYHAAVEKLDDAMAFGNVENMMRRPVKLGSPSADDAFWRNKGRPQDEFQFVDGPLGPQEMKVTGPSVEAGTVVEGAVPGKKLPNLPKDTRPGTQMGPAPGEIPVGPQDPVISEVNAPRPFTEIGYPPGQGPYAAPSARVGGGFNPAEFPSEMVAKPIQRRLDAPEWLGQDVHPWDQVLMRDGRILPAKSVEQNARDFAAFRDKLGATVPPKPAPGVTAAPESAAAVRPQDAVTVAPGSRRPTVEIPRESAPSPAAAAKAEGSAAVDKYVDDWYQESQRSGGRARPFDKVAARSREAFEDLAALSKGRLDSVAGLDLQKKFKLPEPTTPIGERLDELWTLRRVGEMAADEARGVRTGLSKSVNAGLRGVARHAAGRAGAGMVGAVAGGALGGPVGYALGAALASNYMGFTGKLASAAGRVAQRTAEVGEALLRGRRATMASRAVAGNREYSYGDDEPIRDPVARIQQVHELAASPEVIRSKVRNKLGDLVQVAPELAQAVEDGAVRQITNLSLRAPVIHMSQLGVPIRPSVSKMREWHEYENATHDLDGLLDAAERGALTDVQARALQEQFPEVYAKVVRGILSDPERLRELSTPQLRAAERVLGRAFPLTKASADPAYVARLQTSWQLAAPPQAPARPPSKAQAFKITETPTPSQASFTGRAPGNQ